MGTFNYGFLSGYSDVACGNTNWLVLGRNYKLDTEQKA
jgi:hypothetical protein